MFRLFKQIKETFQQISTAGKTNPVFVYPYSTDRMEKRSQVWENLQKGILFEDNGIFLLWGTPYAEIDHLKESRKDRADRTEWSLGKRTILDGYESNLEVMRWLWKETESMTKIDENLGFDEQGERKFNYLKSYLTELLGEPSKIELEKFGPLDIGEVYWESGIVSVYIIGIEHFNCRYSFHISLTNSRSN